MNILRNNSIFMFFCIVWSVVMITVASIILMGQPGGLAFVFVLATAFVFYRTCELFKPESSWIKSVLSVSLAPLLFTIGIIVNNEWLAFIGYGPFLPMLLGMDINPWPAAIALYACYGYAVVYLLEGKGSSSQRFGLAGIVVVFISWFIRSFYPDLFLLR